MNLFSDLGRGLHEHIGIAASRVDHVFPIWLELDSLELQRGNPLRKGNCARYSQITREPFQRASDGGGSWMHPSHPSHVLGCCGDHKIGTIELVIGCLATPVIWHREPKALDRVGGTPAHGQTFNDVRARCRYIEPGHVLSQQHACHHRPSGVTSAQRHNV